MFRKRDPLDLAAFYLLLIAVAALLAKARYASPVALIAALAAIGCLWFGLRRDMRRMRNAAAAIDDGDVSRVGEEAAQ